MICSANPHVLLLAIPAREGDHPSLLDQVFSISSPPATTQKWRARRRHVMSILIENYDQKAERSFHLLRGSCRRTEILILQKKEARNARPTHVFLKQAPFPAPLPPQSKTRHQHVWDSPGKKEGGGTTMDVFRGAAQRSWTQHFRTGATVHACHGDFKGEGGRSVLSFPSPKQRLSDD